VRPNVEFLRESGITIGRGIRVNDRFETNIPGIYAIGDCAEFTVAPPGRRNIEQIWYSGKMHGELVAANICGQGRPYDPGIFFNSAKFFDIEYQVYGDVPPNLPDGILSLYWEHNSGHQSIRINYRADNQAVTGFNLMGVRYRHKACERWIAEGRPISYVLEHLRAANFDPEFFAEYERFLVEQYNASHGTQLRLKSRGKLLDMIFPKAR